MMRLPDPSPPKLTLADLNADHTALLIPDFDDNAEAMRYIEAHCEELFKHEFNGWWTNEKDWPKDRTWKMFNEWVDITIHSFVLDMDEENPLGYFDGYDE